MDAAVYSHPTGHKCICEDTGPVCQESTIRRRTPVARLVCSACGAATLYVVRDSEGVYTDDLARLWAVAMEAKKNAG